MPWGAASGWQESIAGPSLEYVTGEGVVIGFQPPHDCEIVYLMTLEVEM
jgi:hypothetical protein